jgi:hypothetical protein
MAVQDSQVEIFVRHFADNIMQLSQQGASKLLSKVYNKGTITGDTFTQERIGKWTMQQKTGRGQDTPLRDPLLSRRMGYMKDYDDGHPLDKQDEIKIISDPKSAYTIAARGAIGRQYDIDIINAGLGTSYAGKNGTNAIPLPDSQKILNDSTGMTFDKVLQTKQKFDDDDVPDEGRIFVHSPRALYNILASIPQATSSDYVAVQALIRGDLNEWLGFEWIRSTLLPKSGDIRSNMAYQRTGICLAEGMAPQVEADIRKDKSYLWQLYYAISLGVVRLEEAKVVQIDIDETK